MSESTAAEIIRMEADACERWMDSLRPINRAYLEDALDTRLQYLLFCALSVVVPAVVWYFVGAPPIPILVIAGACCFYFCGEAVQASLELIHIRS